MFVVLIISLLLRTGRIGDAHENCKVELNVIMLSTNYTMSQSGFEVTIEKYLIQRGNSTAKSGGFYHIQIRKSPRSHRRLKNRKNLSSTRSYSTQALSAGCP